MKKIFSLILILICLKGYNQTYNPSIQNPVTNKAVGIALANPTDARTYFYDVNNFVYRAYVDTTEVWTYLNQAKYRTGQFPIIVNTGGSLSNGVITGGTNRVWYYKDGTNRNNLVPMFPITSINGQVEGGVSIGSADSLRKRRFDTTMTSTKQAAYVGYDSINHIFKLYPAPSTTSGVNSVSVTSPLLNVGTATDPNIAIPNAAADGVTRGSATFKAADFVAPSSVIGLNYTGGQKASTTLDGFLSSANWNTFNNKVTTVNGQSGNAIVKNADTLMGMWIDTTGTGIRQNYVLTADSINRRWYLTPNDTSGGGGGGSGTVTSVSGLSPLFTTSNPTTTPTFALSSQSNYTLFGRGSGTGVPSFLSSIDSNWIPTLHSELYYNTKYAALGSGGVPGGSNTQIQYNNSGAFAGSAGLTYNATNRAVTTDSLNVKKTQLDSIKWNSVNVANIPDSIDHFGDSFTVGLEATVQDSAYADRQDAFYNLSASNYALSGSGIWESIKEMYINIDTGHHTFSTVMAGVNDVRYNHTDACYRKIVGGYNAIIGNQFLRTYYAAGSSDPSVSRSGTWNTGYLARSVGGKMVAGASFTQENGAYVEYTFADSTVVVGMIGATPSQDYANFTYQIDGGTAVALTENNMTDGTSFAGYDNERVPFSIIITGLSYGTHTIRITNTSTSPTYLVVDYFGNLLPASACYPIMIFEVPKLSATGYAIFPDQANDAVVDSINRKIDSLVASWPSSYPIKLVKTNDFYTASIPSGDLDADNIHPTNQGHRHIFDGGVAAYPSATTSLSNGADYFDGINRKIVVGGVVKTYAFEGSAFGNSYVVNTSVTPGLQSNSSFSVNGASAVLNYFKAGNPALTDGSVQLRVRTGPDKVIDFSQFSNINYMQSLDSARSTGVPLTIGLAGANALSLTTTGLKWGTANYSGFWNAAEDLAQDAATITEGTLAANIPFRAMYRSASGTNEKIWDNYLGATSINFGAVNDAKDTRNLWLQANRSGASITSVKIPNGQFYINEQPDSAATTVGGCLVRDYATGQIKLGACGSGGLDSLNLILAGSDSAYALMAVNSTKDTLISYPITQGYFMKFEILADSSRRIGLDTSLAGPWVRSFATVGSGVTTMANIGSSPNADGASISGSTLTLQPASASFGGVITTSSQTFAGNKVWNGTANFQNSATFTQAVTMPGGGTGFDLSSSTPHLGVAGGSGGSTTPVFQIGGIASINVNNQSDGGMLFKMSDGSTLTDNSTAASGTVTQTALAGFANSTIHASNSSVTYTNASTLFVKGAPAAGSNVTITNPWAVFINAGRMRMAPNIAYVTQALSDGATITWNVDQGNVGTVTLGGNRTLSITNPIAGGIYTIFVKQDGTGSRTLSLPAGSKVVGGGSGAITLTTTANATDILTCEYDGTNYWWTYNLNFN